MIRKTIATTTLGALAFLLVSPAPGWSSPIDVEINLISSGGGTYTYGISTTSGFTFFGTDTITLSGLSGVTGDTVTSVLFSPLGFTAAGTTSSTAAMALTGAGESVFSGGSSNVGNFNVTSTVLTTGTINWTIAGPDTFNPPIGTYDITGTTTGPVAAVTSTPEPTSLLLLGSGLAGLAYWRRKRAA
jgi:hypothetical protein